MSRRKVPLAPDLVREVVALAVEALKRRLERRDLGPHSEAERGVRIVLTGRANVSTTASILDSLVSSQGARFSARDLLLEVGALRDHDAELRAVRDFANF